MRQYEFQHQPVEDKVHPMELELQQINTPELSALKDKYVNTRQRLFYFENDYGASVLTGPFSLAGEQGMLELAVLKKSDNPDDSDGYSLCYDTPITSDVIFCATEAEVQSYLDQIAGL